MLSSRASTTFVEPLSREQRVRADQVALRLVGCLRQVLAHLPEHQRRPNALARRLNVNRNTCQRITSAVAAEPSALSLAALPGAAGLREFAARLETADFDGELIADLAAAIDAADRLTRDLAGSQSKFARRLRAGEDSGGVDGESSLELRRTLHDCGVQLTGRSIDARLWMTAFKPLDDNPRNEHELLEVLALTGHRAAPSALPLMIGVSEGREGTRHRRRTLTGEYLSGDNPKVLLEPFCTKPLPRITARTTERFIVQTVDVEQPAATPADIVTGHCSLQSPPPFDENPAVSEIWTFLLFPAKRLIFDVYLHRSFANLCTPTLSTQLWEPNYQNLTGARWLSRVPDGPNLQILGGGSEAAATDAYPRYRELCQYAFGQRGWDMADFVGYRCDVVYPLWRAGYLMSFEFVAPAGE